MSNKPGLTFAYENYKGETKIYTVIQPKFHFGEHPSYDGKGGFSSPELGWVITAKKIVDGSEKGLRSFKLERLRSQIAACFVPVENKP